MNPLYVLLVDDEPEIRSLLMRWLEGEGHQVTCAVNGVEAAAISGAKEFDLVVTDVIMPEKDGVQLITEIKKTRPKARVLAMSGGGRVLASDDCLRMARALGSHAAVAKPFTRDQFLGAVTRAIDAPLAVPPPPASMAAFLARVRPGSAKPSGAAPSGQ